jgi:hypothetical protein
MLAISTILVLDFRLTIASRSTTVLTNRFSNV